jgi:lipid II:glycine glycyltransferase (peptidoglycan interpeptide bridge formation enzyme)
MAVRVDPYWSGPDGDLVARGLGLLGYRPMVEPPAHDRSIEVPLADNDEQLLASFHTTTRRNVRRALKLGLTLQVDLDDAGLARFGNLYRDMVERKGASPQSPAFLRSLRDFCRANPERGFVLSSWMEGELLGAIVVFTVGRRAVYAYGATTAGDPTIPKSHLLHFTAMQRARARGCQVYDFGGFDDGAGNEAARTATEKINFFKQGFGGQPIDFVAGHERVLRPLRYHAVRTLHHFMRRG